MATYLLTCDCGNTVPVEVGQAGGRVACSCGTQLEVPTLRKLRHLPVASPAIASPERKRARSAWAARHGVVAAGLILTGVLAVIALWSRLSEPVVPEFDPASRLRAVERGLDEITPVQSWQLWVEIYRPLAESGFSVIEDPHKHAIEQRIAEQRFFQRMMLAIAAVSAVIAAAAAFWPRSGPHRS